MAGLGKVTGFDPVDAARVVTRPAFETPCELGRPIVVGVINNPRSGRNARRRGIQTTLELLATHPWIPHREVETRDQIYRATEDLMAEGCEVLVVNGGDGTVQGVLTAIMASPRTTVPAIAILAGGTTNMIAGDVGAIDCLEDLERFFAIARSGRMSTPLQERTIMSVETPTSSDPMYGMFFGAGAVYQGIQVCRQYIHSVGLRGETGPGVALGLFVARILSGRLGGVFPPTHTVCTMDGERIFDRDMFGFFSSTLHRLFLGLRPFWGEGPGTVRFSSIASPPKHPARAALPLMRGRPNAYLTPENGYMSLNADEIELTFGGGFTLDGELFELEEGSTVTVRGGNRAWFLGDLRG